MQHFWMNYTFKKVLIKNNEKYKNNCIKNYFIILILVL